MAKAATQAQEPEVVTQAEEGQEPQEPQEPEIKDPMQEMVTIKIPKDPVDKWNDSLFVGLNGRRYLIQRGKFVEVPRPVAEIIQHSEEQAEIADAFIEANAG